jgi:hypothetical protein
MNKDHLLTTAAPPRTIAAMRQPRRPLLALLAPLLLACRPAAAPAPPEPAARPAPAAKPAQPRDPELLALADAIDPGDVPPLSALLPPWLADPLRSAAAGADPSELQARASYAYTSWQAASAQNNAFTAGALLDLASALYLAENALLAGAAADPELLALLERAYAVLDQKMWSHEQGFFRQVLDTFVGVAGGAGLLKDQEQAREIGALLRDAVVRAGPARRRAAARLLRDHPTHPSIPAVLGRLADDATQRQDHLAALQITRQRLARIPEPTRAHRAALVHRCLQALDLPCAEEARAALDATPLETGPEALAEERDRRRAIDDAAASAALILELTGAAALDDQLDRGHHLILLGRLSDAEALYSELTRAHPGDARPRAGLAKLLISRDIDLFGAAKHVQEARSLANHDRDAYALAIGLASGQLFSELLPRALAQGDKAAFDDLIAPFFADLRADIRGWSRFEPERGAVLNELVDVIAAALPHFVTKKDPKKAYQVVRTLPPRIDALLSRAPHVDDAWRLGLAVSLLTDDLALAQRLSERPIPPDHKDSITHQLLQLRARRDLILLWEPADAPARLDALRASLTPELRDHDEARELSALAHGVRGLAGDRDALRSALEIYSDLLQRRRGDERISLLSNAAVLHLRLGDGDGASAAFKSAFDGARDDKQRDFIRLAVAASAPGFEEFFDTLGDCDHSAAIRTQALAWRVERARSSGAGDLKALEEQLRQQLRREQGLEIRGHYPAGRLGVLTSGDFNINLGYSARPGLVTTFEVRSARWLIPPAPLPAPTPTKKKR